MTVRELINELIDCDPESDVYIADHDRGLNELSDVYLGADCILQMGQNTDDDDDY